MKKFFIAIAIVASFAATPLSQSLAQTTAATSAAKSAVKKAPVKNIVNKAPKKKTHPKATEVSSGKKISLEEDSDDESSEPEIAGTKTYEFNCELGNKVTIYRNDDDEKYIAIRWDKRVRRLSRVATTTGAKRFENHLAGLVWIGIPAKSMLLDSKKGQQLANECVLTNPAPTTVGDGAAAPTS